MTKKDIILVSGAPQDFDDALSPFAAAGFSIVEAASVDEALPMLDPLAPPALVLLDAREDRDGAALRAKVIRVLTRCALTWVTAATPIDGDDFHDAMEGLGMLPPLPAAPDHSDGEELLAALKKFLPE